MVQIDGEYRLSELRLDSNSKFPDKESSKIRSAIEDVDDEQFLNNPPRGQVKLDEELLSRLEGYTSGPKTEYQLWENSDHAVDLYNPQEQIAVEVEKTELKNVWKIFAKFARGKVGEKKEQIKHGCLIVPVNYPTKNAPINVFESSKSILSFFEPLIPDQEIVVFGYHDPGRYHLDDESSN